LVAKKRLIGIVHDELVIVQLYRNALIAPGFSVSAFTNPLIAFEHFKVNKKSYVLIISDLRMPSLDGIGLIKKVKNMNPDIRTILVTAFEVDDNIFEQYTRENIIDGFLQKPITLRDLVTEVENQLRIHRLQEQKQKT
jgi:DNA-binding NtrC family response regulator